MARGSDAVTFHPDLTRARLMPRTSVTARSRRLLRALGRLGAGQSPRGGELVALPTGAHLRVHWPTTPTSDDGLPAVLQIHGGGLIIGSPRGSDALCRTLADTLGAVVASVGYRLPPEHPYPAPLDDCEAALTWLATHPRVDRSRLALTGDSAGGGLAAAVTARTVDAGAVTLAGQALLYPMLDDRTAADPQAADPPYLRLWNGASNRLGWGMYLGERAATPPTDAVPARRTDLTGFPPTWIAVGTADLFHDEDARYAASLRAAGVECELVTIPGAYHGFDVAEPRAAISRDTAQRRIEALRRMLAVAPR
ncbi:alpha/beta hydrolase [Microcella sp.]|uniref:alpha/beta hydrolase n=1 Tax=Microcella sp. TaxID=1913979 RepID=UPI00391DF2F6